MATCDFRRKLTRQEEMRAAGISLGAAAGVAAVTLYFTRIFMQRTSLRPAPAAPAPHGAAGRTPALR